MATSATVVLRSPGCGRSEGSLVIDPGRWFGANATADGLPIPIDDDHHSMEMYFEGPEGEAKGMEIQYERT
jgi:hypothetical protein